MTPISPTRFEDFLVRLDEFCDKIPGISTLSNLIDLFEKAVLTVFTAKGSQPSSYYLRHIKHKTATDCGLLLIPGLAFFRDPCERGNHYERMGENEKAFKIYKELCESQRGRRCFVELGRCYAKGIGTARDEEKAFEAYCRSGIADIEVARRYEKGIGVAIDGSKAWAIIRDYRGKDEDYHRARCSLYGIGCLDYPEPKPDSTLHSLLDWGAKMGDPKAQLMFAKTCHMSDHERLDWIQRAAKENLPEAQVELAMVLMKENKEKAEQLLECASKGADPETLFYIAEMKRSSAKKGSMSGVLDLYRRAAEGDFVPAQLLLGLWYATGSGVKRDLQKAQPLLAKARENFWEVSSWLQQLEQAPTGWKQQFEKLLEQAQDIPDVKFFNAFMLLEKPGQDKAPSHLQGAKLLQELQELPEAQLLLATCYLTGKGVEKDPDKGWDLMRKAAETIPLAKAFADPFSPKFRHLLHAAAINGWDIAQYYLGIFLGNRIEFLDTERLYWDGLHDSPDDVSFFWIRSAARSGLSSAQFELGRLFQQWENLSHAIAWYSVAAQQNIVEAKRALLDLLKTDMSRPSPKEAAKLCEVLIQTGDVEGYAHYFLGLLYAEGVEPSIVKDLVKAAELYKIAASQGNLAAKFLYAECLEKGAGIAPNPEMAFQMYKEVASLKDDKDEFIELKGAAQQAVGRCYHMGIATTQNLEDAVRWYRQATGSGNLDGMRALASCYEEGKGSPKDIDEAQRLRKIIQEKERLQHTKSSRSIFSLPPTTYLAERISLKLPDNIPHRVR